MQRQTAQLPTGDLGCRPDAEASAACRAPGGQPAASASQEVFLAFGRVFAGTLREGDAVHVLQATYSPAQPDAYRQECKVLFATSVKLCLQCMP